MNKYLRAISANYFFLFINTVFFLVITPTAIRVMGEEMYGLWAMLNSILLLSSVGMLGIGIGVIKFASEDDENTLPINSIISNAIIISLPMAIFVMLCIIFSREWISIQLGLTNKQQTQLQSGLIYTALSIIPQFLGRIPIGYLISQLKNSLSRAVETGVQIATWLGVIIIASISANLAWMALWGLLVQIIGSGILFLIVFSATRFRWEFNSLAFRRILSFSKFTFLETLSFGLFQNLDRLLVGAVLGPVAAGIYSVATSVGLRLTTITAQATEVMITYSSRYATDNDKIKFALKKLMFYISSSLGAMGSLLILWLPEILSLWISPQYSAEYTDIFRIIVLCYSLFTLAHPAKQTLIGLGKIKEVAIIYLVASTLMLCSVYFLSKLYGLQGAAWGNVLMTLLIAYIIIAYASFKIKARELVADTSFGFLLPTISMLLSPLILNFATKLLSSIIIFVIFLLLTVKPANVFLSKNQTKLK